MVETEPKLNTQNEGKISWQGRILSIQCRAWVWRYKLDNRTHHHLGFNVWIQGTAGEKPGKFIIAISDTQYAKLQFRIGDESKGTAWPCIKAKHDIADYYRAGGLKVVSRASTEPAKVIPPFVGALPPLEVFQERGARMLDSKRWRKECFTCMWANKSAVEIEYDFGRVKRYRKETFCYGPKSCPWYDMGAPRPVQYVDGYGSEDTGWMDEICTEGRDD